MITALTALLVLISLGLVVTVPVALATPGEWESSKITLQKGIKLGSSYSYYYMTGIAASIYQNTDYKLNYNF
jgi:photosystem II core protein PsbZ